MIVTKRIALPGIIGVALLILAGCGGSTASHPSATERPITSHPATAPFVEIATISVGGVSKRILTTAPGLTLYYNTADTAKTVTCQGSCTAVWHPFDFAGSGTPLAPPGLPGTLSLLATTGGNQVEYNGHPLYTYAQDVAPGQITGQGLEGRWQVATTDLPAIG